MTQEPQTPDLTITQIQNEPSVNFATLPFVLIP